MKSWELNCNEDDASEFSCTHRKPNKSTLVKHAACDDSARQGPNLAIAIQVCILEHLLDFLVSELLPAASDNFLKAFESQSTSLFWVQKLRNKRNDNLRSLVNSREALEY